MKSGGRRYKGKGNRGSRVAGAIKVRGIGEIGWQAL